MIVKISGTVDTEDYPGVFDPTHDSGFTNAGYEQMMGVRDSGLDVPSLNVLDDLTVEIVGG